MSNEQVKDSMTTLRSYQVDFNRETGEPIFISDSGKVIKLAMLSEVPSIDVRGGRRDPSYLEPLVILPDSERVVSITNPSTLFPKGYFGKENPYQPAREDLADAYVILQGNNRYSLLYDMACKNAQIWKDCGGNEEAYNLQKYDIRPVPFVLLNTLQADNPTFVRWYQLAGNDGVKTHSPKQKRVAAVLFYNELKSTQPETPAKTHREVVAKLFGVVESRILQFGAMSAWNLPSPKGEGEGGEYLLSLIDDDKISLDTAIHLYNLYHKANDKSAFGGLTLKALIEQIIDYLLLQAHAALSEKQIKGKATPEDVANLKIRIFESDIEKFLERFAVEIPAEGSGEGEGEGGEGEPTDGKGEGKAPKVEKTLEELQSELVAVDLNDLLNKVDAIVHSVSTGVVVEEVEGEKVKLFVEFTNLKNDTDFYTEETVKQIHKAILALQKVVTVKTVNEIAIAKENDKALKALEAAQKAQEDMLKAQNSDANANQEVVTAF